MAEKNTVPISLSEETIRKLIPLDPMSRTPIKDAELEAMLRAKAVLRESCEGALAAHNTIMANQMRTAVANAKAARDAAFDYFERAAKRLDDARVRTERSIETIEAETMAPPAPRDAVGELREQELRATLVKLSRDDRAKAINAAILGGDDLLVGAALRAHPLVSGMGKAEIEVRRLQWRKARFPAQVERVVRLRKALDDVDKLASLAMRWLDGLTNAEDIANATKAEEAAKAAMDRAKENAA